MIVSSPYCMHEVVISVSDVRGLIATGLSCYATIKAMLAVTTGEKKTDNGMARRVDRDGIKFHPSYGGWVVAWAGASPCLCPAWLWAGQVR